MTKYRERFKDRIDMTDGSAVINESEYNSIVREAILWASLSVGKSAELNRGQPPVNANTILHGQSVVLAMEASKWV